jgi:hypothetical protein
MPLPYWFARRCENKIFAPARVRGRCQRADTS